MTQNKVRRARASGKLAALCLLAAFAVPQACATNHVMQWSRGQPSIFPNPPDKKKQYVLPAGTMLMLPVAIVWDVATAPFQWLWDTYPYGEELHPKDQSH